MVYRVIGLMSGSSLDGLDICYAHLQEISGKWNYEIVHANCYPYSSEWQKRLSNATQLSARDYLLLHSDYGHYIGKEVNRFISEKKIEYQVQLIGSHGHTTFHMPPQKMTAQLGDGAAIAAETGINTVTDLRALDVALNGQGAPIVPIGERLLLPGFDYFLNLGGIANLSANITGLDNLPSKIAFDVSPANRVLNLLVAQDGDEFDEGGRKASQGNVDQKLLDQLNSYDYYEQPFPKSLANDFGTEIIYPAIKNSGLEVRDALRTMVEHIVFQIKQSIDKVRKIQNAGSDVQSNLLITGGGAFNDFVVERLRQELQSINVEVVVAEKNLVQYKEALIMGLIGVLRWREENNLLGSVTGARRDSIGGAVWIGQS